MSFNPCSDGKVGNVQILIHLCMQIVVLILVVMEWLVKNLILNV